jgi:hypothetical protein
MIWFIYVVQGITVRPLAKREGNNLKLRYLLTHFKDR